MQINGNGSQRSGKGPADYFTGSVRVDPLFNPPEPARVLQPCMEQVSDEQYERA
jgi:hypothetical protein